MSLPWDQLDTALEALDEANRLNIPEAVEEAEKGVADARDRLAMLAAMLMAASVTRESYVPAGVWVAIGDKLGVDAIARQALSEANHASRKAQIALEKIDGLMSLIRAMEQRIDNLTPGVGKPE